VHPSASLVHHRQRLVEGEDVGFLNGREVLEGLGPFGGRCLRADCSITVFPAFG
jgi:hypothetical protein